MVGWETPALRFRLSEFEVTDASRRSGSLESHSASQKARASIVLTGRKGTGTQVYIREV